MKKAALIIVVVGLGLVATGWIVVNWFEQKEERERHLDQLAEARKDKAEKADQKALETDQETDREIKEILSNIDDGTEQENKADKIG